MSDLINRVRDHGAQNAQAASELAQTWREWVNRLADLVESVPHVSAASYLDSDGREVDVSLGNAEPSKGMRANVLEALNGALSQADSIECAIARSTVRVERGTLTSLRELIPPDEVLTRKLTAEDVRRWPYYFITGPGRARASATRCPHEYFLTDSCPGCDADAERDPYAEPPF